MWFTLDLDPVRLLHMVKWGNATIIMGFNLYNPRCRRKKLIQLNLFPIFFSLTVKRTNFLGCHCRTTSSSPLALHKSTDCTSVSFLFGETLFPLAPAIIPSLISKFIYISLLPHRRQGQGRMCHVLKRLFNNVQIVGRLYVYIFHWMTISFFGNKYISYVCSTDWCFSFPLFEYIRFGALKNDLFSYATSHQFVGAFAFKWRMGKHLFYRWMSICDRSGCQKRWLRNVYSCLPLEHYHVCCSFEWKQIVPFLGSYIQCVCFIEDESTPIRINIQISWKYLC